MRAEVGEQRWSGDVFPRTGRLSSDLKEKESNGTKVWVKGISGEANSKGRGSEVGASLASGGIGRTVVGGAYSTRERLAEDDLGGGGGR